MFMNLLNFENLDPWSLSSFSESLPAFSKQLKMANMLTQVLVLPRLYFNNLIKWKDDTSLGALSAIFSQLWKLCGKVWSLYLDCFSLKCYNWAVILVQCHDWKSGSSWGLADNPPIRYSLALRIYINPWMLNILQLECYCLVINLSTSLISLFSEF